MKCKEKIKIYNGIKNYKSNVKGMGSFYIIFENAVNVETNQYLGISHLIEHCMCEQIKKYESDFKIAGISFNACTEITKVKFYITGLDEGIKKFRKIFYDEIINYNITEDVFNREKSIVIQEYNDCISSPQGTFFENVYRKYFNTTLPGGDLTSLKKLTYEDFIKFKNYYFNYPTYICNTSTSKIKYKDNDYITIKKNYNLIDKTDDSYCGEKLKLIEGNMSDSSSIIGYFNKFKFDENDLKKYAYYEILTNYMGQGLTSPLYKELREDTGHVYSISCYVESLYEQTNASFNIIVNVDPNFVEEIKEKLLKCINYYFNHLEEERFNSSVIGIKNEILKTNYLKFCFTNSFNQKMINFIKDFNFNFEEFKNYAIQLITEKKNYILIDDKHI